MQLNLYSRDNSYIDTYMKNLEMRFIKHIDQSLGHSPPPP